MVSMFNSGDASPHRLDYTARAIDSTRRATRPVELHELESGVSVLARGLDNEPRRTERGQAIV